MQAVSLSPSQAGLAGRSHKRLLAPPAFPTCSCPLRLSPLGASDGPEVSLRTSLNWVKDSVPRTAAHTFAAHGSSIDWALVMSTYPFGEFTLSTVYPVVTVTDGLPRD
jgi:hypothetical protein